MVFCGSIPSKNHHDSVCKALLPFCLLPTTILCPVIQMSPPETKARWHFWQKRSGVPSVEIPTDWFRYNHEIDPKRWLWWVRSNKPQFYASNFLNEKLNVAKRIKKSRIQHCERSELRLHFEWAKVD